MTEKVESEKDANDRTLKANQYAEIYMAVQTAKPKEKAVWRCRSNVLSVLSMTQTADK